jgi:hypothetical protein
MSDVGPCLRSPNCAQSKVGNRQSQQDLRGKKRTDKSRQDLVRKVTRKRYVCDSRWKTLNNFQLEIIVNNNYDVAASKKNLVRYTWHTNPRSNNTEGIAPHGTCTETFLSCSSHKPRYMARFFLHPYILVVIQYYNVRRLYYLNINSLGRYSVPSSIRKADLRYGGWPAIVSSSQAPSHLIDDRGFNK